MKYLIYSLSLIFLASCADSEIEGITQKENCDFEVCENGRNSIDTLTNEHGVLKINNSQYVIGK